MQELTINSVNPFEEQPMEYAVWIDQVIGLDFGETKKATGKIVCFCPNYEYARVAWKYHYYN